MSRHLVFEKLNHLNAVVDGYRPSIDLQRDLFGAQLLMEIPGDDVDACLVAVGRVIIELFAPKNDATGTGRLLARYGGNFHGVEFKVPDLREAFDLVRQSGVRIILSVEDQYFLTHPGDCQGVSFEIYAGDWHAVPPPSPFLEPIAPAAYWADEHPLGLLGLAGFSVAVPDMDRAVDFFAGFAGAVVAYRGERPSAGATATGLSLGGETVELLTPTGPGPVADFLDRFGPRIRAATFRVRDLDAAARHLAHRGLALVEGDAPGTLAVPESANLGLRYELAGPDVAR